MQTDQNGEEGVLMKDNYWSSVHLSGGEEEIPTSAVEIEFHTGTKINSPSDASRSTHRGGVPPPLQPTPIEKGEEHWWKKTNIWG